MNDNPALAAAAEAGEVVPVFCFERGLWASRHASANRNADLLATLRELDESLRAAGRGCTTAPARRGCRSRGWPRSAARRAVHVNRDHTAHSRSRDRAVGSALTEIEVELVGHPGLSCAEIARIETGRAIPTGCSRPLTGLGEGPPARPGQAPPQAGSPSGVAAGSILTEGEMGVDASARRIAAASRPGRRRRGS